MPTKRTYRILAFCASGVATSTLIAKTAQSRLEDLGYRVESETCNSAQISSRIGAFDLLVTSVDPKTFKDLGKPVVRAVALLTGIGEDECIEEIAKVLDSIK
jgi:galactitol PTS system EIIB component